MRVSSLASAVLTTVLFLCFITTAQAGVVSFGDTAKTWPGWTTDSDADNNTDNIGTPNLLGGRVIYDDNFIVTRVEIDIQHVECDFQDLIISGDLAFNLDGDNDVEYFVSIFDGQWADVDAPNFPTFPQGGALVEETFDGEYQITGVPADLGFFFYESELPGGLKNNSLIGGNYNIRNNHPVGFIPNGEVGGDDVILDGWLGPLGNCQDGDIITLGLTFTADAQVIDLSTAGGDFDIYYTVNCANDVICENVEVPAIPAPAAVILLACGLLGFMGVRRLQ
jgi:hypothetical protein